MESSQLNCLPPELRNYIHQFTLAYDGPRQVAQEPAITQTCKQIRAETLLMYYANSDGFEATVETSGPRKLTKWLKERDVLTLDDIKRLTITSSSAEFENFDQDSLQHKEQWRLLCSTLTEKGFTPDRLKVRVDSRKSTDMWIMQVKNYGDELDKEVCQSTLDRRFRNRFLRAWRFSC